MKTESLPAEVDASLQESVEALQHCFQNNLVNITLFGSGAEGALRKSSDLNLLIVLDSFDTAQAQKVRPIIEKLSRSRKTSVMFLLKSEVPEAAEAFAIKFDDIARRHRTLFGEDITRLFRISREAKKALLQQTLMNYILRMRSRYATEETRSGLLLALSQSAGPLRAAAATLLELENQPADSPRAALDSLAAQSGPSCVGALQAMTRVRGGEILEESVTESSLEQLMRLAEQLYQRTRKIT